MNDTTRRPSADLDELSMEGPPYRPTSPWAMLGLIFGVLSALGVILAHEVGAVAFAPLPLLGIALGLFGASCARKYDQAGRLAAQFGAGLAAAALVAGVSLDAYLYYYVDVPEGALRISYANLQPKAGEAVASSAAELDGKKVYIEGYVYPTDQMTGIKEFLLCRDKGECCFGGQPKLTDTIQVRLDDKLALNYDQNVHAVAGVFRLQKGGPGAGLKGAPAGGLVYALEADFLR